MKNKFGVQLSHLEEDFWSFGVALNHMHSETYVTVYFHKALLTIGKFFH